MATLNKVLAYFESGVCCLVADCEFIGRDWFAFLLEQQVDFVIRLRGNMWLTLDEGRRRYAATHLQCTHSLEALPDTYYPHTTLYDGLTLNLVCLRPVHGQRILLITNRIDLQQILSPVWPTLGYRDDLCLFEIEGI